jgi:predicted AlkP superfamily pyrophosphatase or phosphodiesterase
LLDFAKRLMAAEAVGVDATPDYLSISFSGVDAVNHFFGPSSLENEDQVLQLDRTLADLFSHIDKTIGLDKTIIALSADHGMADMPEYLAELGYEAGRIYPDEIVAAANKIGKELFGLDNLAKQFFRPYLYLDDTVISKAGLSKDRVHEIVAARMIDLDGIALAVPRPGLKGFGDRKIRQQIARNYHPQRSGDIYIAQAPYWFSFEKGPIAAMHGSPWHYDTHVPIIFAGAGIAAARISRPVHPVDVAPTLAALLRMTPPASSQGEILSEVLR